MKKIFTFIFCFFLLFNLCCSENLYVRFINFKKPSSQKMYEDILSELKKEGEYYDFNIIDDSESADKYPAFELKLGTSLNWTIYQSEKIYSRSSFSYFLNERLYADENGITRSDEIVPSAIASELITNYVTMKDFQENTENVTLLDAFVPSNYYGREKKSDDQQKIYCVVLDDDSLFIKEGKTLYKYNSKVLFDFDVFEKMQLNDKVLSTTWIPFVKNGKSVCLVNDFNKSIYEINSKGEKIKTQNVTFPSTNEFNYFNFSADGNLFFSNNKYYELDTVYNFYFPSTDYDQAINFPSFSVYEKFPVSVHIGNNNDVWIYENMITNRSMEYGKEKIAVYDKSGKLKKVIYEKNTVFKNICKNINNKNYEYSSKSSLFGILSDENHLIKHEIFKNRKVIKTYVSMFDNHGSCKWTLELPEEYLSLTFEDYRNGIYYFADQDTKSIIRVTDDSSILKDNTKVIADSYKLITENSKDYKQYLKIADAYFADGCYWLAYENYEKYLKFCPADSTAQEKHFIAEVELQKIKAKELSDRVFVLLDEYGEESARLDYTASMKILEKLKKQVPWDAEVQQLYNELKESFNPGSGSSNIEISVINVNEVKIEPIFPALLNVYSKFPTGSISVKNESDKEIRNLKIKTYIRKYMDFPTESDVIDFLPVNGNCNIPVKTIFNNSILNINEDTNVQTQITVEWEQNNQKQNITITRPVTIYKKTAMSWVDTGMLSCFIMPNNETVSSFAFASIDGGKSQNKIFTKKFFDAMTILNSLGSLPLNYIPDPVTPATDIVGNMYAIDTVRFPQNTLSLRGGDCDDMTALCCSLLEAAGIKTSLITTPGHIFAAFNPDIKSNYIWDNLTDYKIINADGQVWIPFEVTILSKGFAQAWKKASEEIKDGMDEFIVVSEMRAMYPPIAVENENIQITPDVTKLVSINTDTAELIEKELLNYIEQYDSEKNAAKLNSLAKFYCYLNKDLKAIEILQKAVICDKNYDKAYNNLEYLCKKNDCMDMMMVPAAIRNSKTISDIKKADNITERAANAYEDYEWDE